MLFFGAAAGGVTVAGRGDFGVVAVVVTVVVVVVVVAVDALVFSPLGGATIFAAGCEILVESWPAYKTPKAKTTIPGTYFQSILSFTMNSSSQYDFGLDGLLF